MSQKKSISVAQLEQEFEEFARGDEGSLLAVTFPAPTVRHQALLKAYPSMPASWWWAPGKMPEISLGAVAVLTARGEGRFGQIEKQAHQLWDGLIRVERGTEAMEPCLFGGASFGDDFSGDSSWSDFAPAEFLLPRWRFSGDSLCTVHVRKDEVHTPAQRNRWARLTLELLNLTDFGETAAVSDNPGDIFDSSQAVPDIQTWAQKLELAGKAFESGELKKVVLARKVILQARSPLDLIAVWNRMGKWAEKETRFAFRRGLSTFMGASPERLVARQGRMVMADALAGSLPATSAGGREALLGSEKNLREHEFVVREIASRLALLGAVVEALPLPAIRELRHVWHLHTPVRATFSNPPHILRLLEKLHPTPAVGGTPSRKAMEFLTQHESWERGWYAGPVGWFSESGDGDFAVGLRSGLFQEAQVQLFAGAGLVRGSEFRSEWEETEWKLRAMLEVIS